VAYVPGENTLPARLETAMFLGERWEYLFHAGELRIGFDIDP
jgi:iron(III) transport system ATP-binding protein